MTVYISEEVGGMMLVLMYYNSEHGYYLNIYIIPTFWHHHSYFLYSFLVNCFPLLLYMLIHQMKTIKKHYSMRYCIEIYCSMRYCIEIYCCMRYCIEICCSMRYCIEIYCSMVYCIEIYCSMRYCIQQLLESLHVWTI